MVGAWPRLAAVAALVLLAAFPLAVRAAGPIVPDSSCADESTYKSLKGDAPAALEVFNKSPETVKVWWLDYSGKRVLYQVLPPFTDYVQRTWLTHPWVITDVNGRCYRFLVMTSQLQSVTVEGEPPDPETTTLPLSARLTAAPPTTAPTVVVTAAPSTPRASIIATSSPAATSTTPAGSPGAGTDNAAVVVVGAVAAVAVAAGIGLAATGHVPGARRGRRPGA